MMRLKYSFITTVVLLFLVVSSTYAFLSAEAKISIRVVDESGVPVKGARVGASFKTVRTSEGTVSTNAVNITDQNGVFEGQELCDGHIGWNIKKYGYYETRGTYDFQKETALRWEPWNPIITSVLRKIENPVPMYIKDTKDQRLEIPKVDRDIGFDLFKFDWMPPYGKGEKPDVVFHLKRRFVKWNDRNCELIITFSNKNDGIIKIEENQQGGSLFKLPRYAPVSGYADKLILYNNFQYGLWESNIKESDSYIFRIRTKKENEKIVQALYGKIVGQLDFSAIGTKTAFIIMNYYLNPDGSRNLEHDPNRNLFYGKDLNQ